MLIPVYLYCRGNNDFTLVCLFLISFIFYDLFGQISNLAFRPLLRLHQFGCQCLYLRIFQSYKLPKWANNESEHTKKNGNATKKSVSLFCTLVGWQKQNKTRQPVILPVPIF